MKRKPNFLTMALLLGALGNFVTAADMNEKEVPPGWELSATLALFRNLPLLDVPSFPATRGVVHFSTEAESHQEKVVKFINTYRFFRETAEGKFLELSVVEEHQLIPSEEDSQFLASPTHRVADLKASMQIVDQLPANTSEPAELSKLLGYILDHGVAFLNSEAGSMAKSLNYQPSGRVRSPDYVQPRICYLEGASGNIETVRIYGLSSLIRQSAESVSQEGLQSETQVLELSVDDSGAAVVSFKPLKGE